MADGVKMTKNQLPSYHSPKLSQVSCMRQACYRNTAIVGVCLACSESLFLTCQDHALAHLESEHLATVISPKMERPLDLSRGGIARVTLCRMALSICMCQPELCDFGLLPSLVVSKFGSAGVLVLGRHRALSAFFVSCCAAGLTRVRLPFYDSAQSMLRAYSLCEAGKLCSCEFIPGFIRLVPASKRPLERLGSLMSSWLAQVCLHSVCSGVRGQMWAAWLSMSGLLLAVSTAQAFLILPGLGSWITPEIHSFNRSAKVLAGKPWRRE